MHDEDCQCDDCLEPTVLSDFSGWDPAALSIEFDENWWDEL